MTTTSQTFAEAIQAERTTSKLFDCAMRAALEADELRERLAAAKAEIEKWKQQYFTVIDERAASFARIGRALGGMSLTEYQPEIDIEIEAAAKAAQADTRRLDWLATGDTYKKLAAVRSWLPLAGYPTECAGDCIRAAIDAAMKEAAP